MTYEIDWNRWQPTEHAALCFLLQENRVLLIHKKRGLGAGKINAPGGRQEGSETLAATAIRETEEEVGLVPQAPRCMGRMRFAFTDGYHLEVHIFTATSWTGTMKETDEALPFWVSRDAIPYDTMWADDVFWLPHILSGRFVEGEMVFRDDAMLWWQVRYGEGDDMSAQQEPSVTRASFGELPSREMVERITLRGSGGMEVDIIDYGATITAIRVPDHSGVLEDVTLGFDSLAGYVQEGNPYMGSTVGRVANRIAGGRFSLNGTPYQLPCNEGTNHLHGGPGGFDRQMWRLMAATVGAEPQLTLSHRSKDGTNGYPGTVGVTVAFTVTADNTLRITYSATTDAPTPINLTNHTYFNLDRSDTILSHVVHVSALAYTPVREDLIPTGGIVPVQGTPFDLTTPRVLREVITLEDEQLRRAGGFDHNFVCHDTGELQVVARVWGPESKRLMEVATTEPGIQFYSGNFLDGSLTGCRGGAYRKHSGFCLETQHFPDAPNQPLFPSIILSPQQTFSSTTEYHFSVADGPEVM